MWFVRTYLKANLKISFKLKTFFLLQTPLLRIYSIEVKLPIHRDVIGAKIVDIRSGKNFVTKWVRAKPVGTGILWKAERCARTPQIVTCHMSQKSDSCHLPGKWEEEGFFFSPDWLAPPPPSAALSRPKSLSILLTFALSFTQEVATDSRKGTESQFVQLPPALWRLLQCTSPLGPAVPCGLSCRKHGLHREAPGTVPGSELKLFCLQFLVSLGNSLVITALWSYSSWAAVAKYQRLAGLAEIYFLRAL